MPSITRRPRAMPVEARRPAIEARLLAATERLLADGTAFTELSIQQLCSEAGIARSTFYVYFRDKSDLVIRLAEELVGELAEAASTWWRPGAPYEELRAAARRVVAIYAQHEALFAALTETAAYDPELRAVQEAIVERSARPLEELVNEGQRDGTVRPVHAHETVAALAWMLQGACYHLAPGADEAALDRLAEALTSIVWHALYPDQRTERMGT